MKTKKTIDALSDLPEDLKNRLKDEIDNALTSKEINRIKNKAELLAKIEQLKKVITPNQYALDKDPEVRKIIDETIERLKISIDGIEEGDVQAKKDELDSLKSKLSGLKKEIEDLTENDVLDVQKTKKELAIQLAKDMDDVGIEDTKLYIKKAKLKKKASKLEYPTKQNSLAISKLNTKINDATLNDIDNVEKLINDLPKKIEEAKTLINAVNSNNNDKDGKRRQDLIEQLDRTITDEEFAQLKTDIQNAKTQSVDEYNKALKDKLKRQVDGLNYPIPSNQTEAEAKNTLKTKIDSLPQNELETFDNIIDKIGKKIAEAKNKISKLSPSKTDLGILETSKTSELSDFDKLLQKLDQLRNEDRNEINKKIEELNELTLEEKTKYKNDVNLADSYSDMLEILGKARNKHLEKLVDKLPYPSNNGRGKNILKANVISANNANDSTFKNQKDALEKVRQAIIKAKERIKNLPYSKNDTPGRRLLNQKLDEATTETEIKEIANDELKQKIQKYKELIQKVGDFTLPKPNQNNLINGRLDHLPDTNENELKKQIYETKRQQVALREINKLSNIKQKDKKDKLKNDIVAWNPTVDNNLSIDDFIKKVNDVDKKIIDAYKEDLKAKVDALPYPNPNSNEAQTAKNTLKSEIEKLSTKAQSNDEYAKLNNLISKIKELKNKALSIVNANEKIEVEKLINGLDNENKVANIELAILKAKAKDTIDTIVNLSDTEKNSLKSEVVNAQNNDQINNIVSKARKLGEFNRRKNAIKKIIDSIPYPRQNSTIAEKSIKSLKDQVNALIDDTTKINELEKKINDLKASVETLVENANNIDYIKNDAHKPLEALNKIKEKIDGLTDASKVTDVLPNDYANKIFKYKDIINKTFKDANIKDKLLTKLNKAVPNNYDGNYKLSNLDSDLLAKLKEQAIAKINNMSNLDEAKRNVHKAKVNSVNSSNDLNKYQTTVIDVIDNFVIEGYKENYNIFIDKLPYPSDDENNAASLRTKTALKNTHVKNINKLTNIQNLEKTLNDFATKVKAVQSSIAGISNTNDQNKTAIKNFNKQFASFGQGTKLDNLKKLVDNYKTISAEFNKFIPYTGSPAEDVKAANKSLEALKIKLWDELAKIGSKALQDQLVGIINENLELYKKSKTLFSGDILVATNFLDESLNLLNTKKDKTTVADVRTIINKMQPYKDELNRFWTKEKGDYLRGRKDQWFNSIPQNTPNPINVDQFKFLTYDLLIKKIRSRKTAAEVKKIVDVEVEQYKALFEFRQAYENSNSANIPAKVKDSLKHKILNVSTDATKVQMDQITKYLGQRITTGNNVTSGFYLDAKYLLDSLNNSIDNESDKEHFKTLFDNIGVANSGQSYEENVTQKIDNFRKEIKDFISKLSDANAKKKIEDIINQIKDQAEKQKLLDKLKKKNISIRELESIKNDANKQKEKELSEAKEEAKKIIDQIGYPGGKNSNAITTLKHQVDNAKSVDDIARLNENNKKIKEAVKRALDAIDKLTDEMTKKNLKSELDSTISIDGENSGIKYITGKAIMKHREALEKKKSDIQKSIEKQKDSADKKDLLNQLKHIESEKDLDMVKQQLSLIQKKDGLKDEVSKLALFDLSGHLNENGSRGRGGLNSSQLSMLNKRISDATTEQALNLIKNDINKQKDAELVDLALDETNGGIRIDSLNGETTYTDFSEMKKFLFDIIFGIKTIKNDTNQYERNKFEIENQKLQNKIKYQTKTVEQYRQVKKEAEEFVKKWEGGATRSWEQFFIERIEKHSNETPKKAGPFPVNVQSELIEAIKSKLRNKGISREQAIILENEYLKKTFFDARRLKKLNYDYLQFIKYLKLNPWLDDNEKSLLDLQYKRFESAPTVREKEAIALNIDPKLVGAGIDINNSWRSSSQVEFVDWWITKIVESSESVISQENKYIWIDKIALTIDEEKSVAVKLWNDFRKQYPRLLDGTILNRDGFPERNAPFFLGN
ncbi:GA module-containing protein [Mycoplasmopsis cynos]|uniref:Protein G-related albumin-binding (GA) module domain-containing protein n=1 Tax=Mycoplasmopsis cynos (strain C142) TaxID=1246955 RepID=L0RXG6_MYCC1|nr:GA module-containing protein [Mycoplasmopsis cynos]CCP24286.1 Hypothetical protein MCYN_0554 [Mycoplasmopsis cynos C142]